jgi:toxin ParE1/3/4
MLRYFLSISKSAELDIINFADWTIENFGIKQIRKYRDGLISCFEEMTNRPEKGKLYLFKDEPLLLRSRYKSHLVFYNRTNIEILIIRVLGERMYFISHL